MKSRVLHLEDLRLHWVGKRVDCRCEKLRYTLQTTMLAFEYSDVVYEAALWVNSISASLLAPGSAVRRGMSAR